MMYPLALDIEISRDDLLCGALQVVRIVKPAWASDEIQHKIFTVGKSNRLYGFYLDKDGDMLLVRINGENTETFVDRRRELEYLQVLHEYGCSAQVHACFKNGMCYDYVRGRMVGVDSVRDPKVYPLICDEMAKIHSIDLGPAVTATLWSDFQKFFARVPERFDDPGKQFKFVGNLPDKEELGRLVDQLKVKLSKAPQPVALCHNDLLGDNIILSPDENSVRFIDFEFGGPNPTAFDIGNHFNEWSGTDVVDYSRLPTIEERREWIRLYLRSSKKYAKAKCLTVTDSEVEEMLRWANKFAVASHLFWALWALVQAVSSSLDFDYLEYAIIRFREYEKQLAATDDS